MWPERRFHLAAFLRVALATFAFMQERYKVTRVPGIASNTCSLAGRPRKSARCDRVFLCALWTLVCGCRDEKEQAAPAQPQAASAAVVTTEPAVHNVGQIARAEDYVMSVEAIEECSVSAPFAPRANKKLVGVEVTIEGTSNREVPVNPFYATLSDEEADKYSSTLAGCKPALHAERVTTGKRAKGFISFEIPKSAGDLKLSYAPLVIGVGREELLFDLRH